MASIEENVEDAYKDQLRELGLKLYAKNQEINASITRALKEADSKSGGSGRNYPDIQAFISEGPKRHVPVMIECKGTKGHLEKTDRDGLIASDAKSVVNYAVNGAIHYAKAILENTDYTDVIAIGMNGSRLNADGLVADLECKAYLVSRRNNLEPKLIPEMNDDLRLLDPKNKRRLFAVLDGLNLTEEEREDLKRRTEISLEAQVKDIHQKLYDDEQLKTLLGTNEKLYLFCGLIMAGLHTQKISPLTSDDFKGNEYEDFNDGTVILNQIKAFLHARSAEQGKIGMIINLLQPVFTKKELWYPSNGESILKNLFVKIRTNIIPLLESDLHLDFTGRILNSLTDWVSIDNDANNDVVLTPHYITSFMARLARVDKDSYVFDSAMGSGGFLVSAMEIMIKDAESTIFDEEEREKKIRHIKEHQLLGIEILGNIYVLAVLNMILMGDGSSNIVNADSHEYKYQESFIPTVFLLNPPYSAPGKGLIFAQEAFEKMEDGYGAILIQENAGSGQGQPYAKKILEKNTLLASIHMPSKLFSGKASVQTAIYVFRTGRPHEIDDLVKFIDFSEDGYTRQNRKKATQAVNLKDTDHAEQRYAEVEAIVSNKKPATHFYTKEGGLLIEDSISLNGDDWTFVQHRVIDTRPTQDDFYKTVADYLNWTVEQESIKVKERQDGERR